MKRNIIFLVTLLTPCLLFSDSPGKRAMSDSKITFQDVGKLSCYSLVWTRKYDTARIYFHSDTSLILPSSGGAPDNAMVWGIDKKSGQNTDTIFFENYYAPDYVIIFDSSANGKLLYQKRTLSNANETSLNDTTGIANKDLIKEAETARTNHNTKITILALSSVLALTAIIFFFVHRRNQRKQTQV